MIPSKWSIDRNTMIELLNEGGIGIVEVPNFDMMLKNNLFTEFINDHLFYFTKDTLASTLERNGFEVLKCENVWHDYIISATVKKRKTLDLSFFEFSLPLPFRKYFGNVVCDCGPRSTFGYFC